MAVEPASGRRANHLRGAHPEAEEKVVRMLRDIHGRMLDDGERNDRGGNGGRAVRPLRLDPEDLARMGAGIGLDGAETAELFRGLVRGNYVRLRGRYREGVTGRSAPAYVSGLTERGLREARRAREDATQGPPETADTEGREG